MNSSPVIDAYDDARAAGRSRAESFSCAVRAFRVLRPELSSGEAGTEVARMLLHAAAMTRMTQGCRPADAMPRPVISW